MRHTPWFILLSLSSPPPYPSPMRLFFASQCTLNWTFASKWVIIASMPILAIACTVIVAILVKIKNVLLEKWEDWRGRPLSPPTEIDALYGLLFASFYYLYLQVWRRWCWPWLLLARACPVLTGTCAPRLAPPCQVVK